MCSKDFKTGETFVSSFEMLRYRLLQLDVGNFKVAEKKMFGFISQKNKNCWLVGEGPTTQ